MCTNVLATSSTGAELVHYRGGQALVRDRVTQRSRRITIEASLQTRSHEAEHSRCAVQILVELEGVDRVPLATDLGAALFKSLESGQQRRGSQAGNGGNSESFTVESRSGALGSIDRKER